MSDVNPIQMIYDYNKEKGLLDAGYSDQRESAFPIEEMLEGFSDLNALATTVQNAGVKLQEPNPKYISRGIVQLASLGTTSPIVRVARLDKHLDAIVYNFGAVFKQGLSVPQALQALSIVMTSNLGKSNTVDEAGKNIKGAGFVPPEEQLQALLDTIDADASKEQ